MKVLIENYRGWEIYFDTDKEDFYTVSNEYDYQQNKRSYASTKKFIDDYLKENLSFKPIKVMRMRTMWDSPEIITLIGIRKDGAFMYEDKNGEKKQLSKYGEESYFALNAKNEPIFKELDELYQKQKDLSSLIKSKEEKVIKLTVPQIRENILGKN